MKKNKIRAYIDKMIKYVFDSNYRFIINTNNLKMHRNISDKEFIEHKYEYVFNEKVNYESPKRFNEKLQWLKIYDRKEKYSLMVDKYQAKKYVADLIGEEHIIPTIGVWNNVEEIDFNALPNKFVLKCNHNSGLGMYICKDKNKADFFRIKHGLNKGLKENYYLKSREWPYKNVVRKIIAEQYLEDDSGNLTDYKVHCFNGVPRVILVCKDRFTKNGFTEDFYTTDWQHIPLKRPKINNSKEPIKCPEELTKILELSKKLSENIPFVRVDFYIVNHKVYFSELTFFPASGFERFEPDEWDYILGDYLELPN